MSTRNSETLASFVAYCEASPDLRFWQALANWAGWHIILASKPPIRYDSDAVVWRPEEVLDPYNWEGKDGGQAKEQVQL
jgi:hypothetical protein